MSAPSSSKCKGVGLALALKFEHAGAVLRGKRGGAGLTETSAGLS